MSGNVSNIRDYRRRRPLPLTSKGRGQYPHRRRKKRSLRLVTLSIFTFAGLAIAMSFVPDFEPTARSSANTLPSARSFTVAASSVRIVDGDTVDIGPERFRLDQWDTPEKFGGEKCPREKQLGERATRAARKLFRQAEHLTIIRGETDAYGRTVSRWILDGRDYGGLLYQQGLAQPWAYGRQAKPDWCS